MGINWLSGSDYCVIREFDDGGSCLYRGCCDDLWWASWVVVAVWAEGAFVDLIWTGFIGIQRFVGFLRWREVKWKRTKHLQLIGILTTGYNDVLKNFSISAGGGGNIRLIFMIIGPVIIFSESLSNKYHCPGPPVSGPVQVLSISFARKASDLLCASYAYLYIYIYLLMEGMAGKWLQMIECFVMKIFQYLCRQVQKSFPIIHGARRKYAP